MRARLRILLVLLLAAIVYTHFLSDVHPVPLREPLADVPTVIGDWRSGRSESMSKETLQLVGVEDYLWRDYLDQTGFPVSVYVGYYDQQREGDTIHSPKHCLPGGGWRPLESDEIRFGTPGFNGGSTRANRYVIQKGEDRQFVLYWYQSRGRNITNEYEAKVFLVLDSILRKRNDGSLIRFMAPLGDRAPQDLVQEKVTEFARAFLPELARAFPR